MVEEVHQVLQATAKAIHRPCHDNIELPSRNIPVQPVKRWTLVTALGSGNAVVLVNLDNLVPKACGYCL